jgi:hypothetical protein
LRRDIVIFSPVCYAHDMSSKTKKLNVSGLDSEDILQVGWGIKEGGRHKSWKKRFFVVRKDRMEYYKSENDSAAIGSIPFLYSAVGKTPPSYTSRPNCFQIITDARTYHICAASAEEEQLFLTNISRSIRSIFLVNDGKESGIAGVHSDGEKEHEETIRTGRLDRRKRGVRTGISAAYDQYNVVPVQRAFHLHRPKTPIAGSDCDQELMDSPIVSGCSSTPFFSLSTGTPSGGRTPAGVFPPTRRPNCLLDRCPLLSIGNEIILHLRVAGGWVQWVHEKNMIAEAFSISQKPSMLLTPNEHTYIHCMQKLAKYLMQCRFDRIESSLAAASWSLFAKNLSKNGNTIDPAVEEGAGGRINAPTEQKVRVWESVRRDGLWYKFNDNEKEIIVKAWDVWSKEPQEWSFEELQYAREMRKHANRIDLVKKFHSWKERGAKDAIAVTIVLARLPRKRTFEEWKILEEISCWIDKRKREVILRGKM